MSSAKLIKPIPISDVMLLTSNAIEPASDEIMWSPGNYSTGQSVIYANNHVRYKRLAAGTSSLAPPDDGANWKAIGMSNRWAMFDRRTGTSTSLNSTLNLVLKPGGISGLALLGLIGRKVFISMKSSTAGTEVYRKDIDLDSSIISSVYEWFTADLEMRSDIVLTDLPEFFFNCELSISITPSGGKASCGTLQVGKVVELGKTQYGANVGIIDFSKKSTDEFGISDVVERPFSKRNSLKIITEKSDLNKLYRLLTNLRATPCIYIGVEDEAYEPLIVYGYYKDFSIEISYPSYHLCNLEIEGLI